MKSNALTARRQDPCPQLLRKAVVTALAAWILVLPMLAAEKMKVGIIGLDAHAVPWTRIIHDPAAKPPIADMRIVAAVPVPSPDIPFSVDNIQQNVTQMRELGVEVITSIEELVQKVDAVMLLSIDGRPHPAQARSVFRSKKPLFIDKPIAGAHLSFFQKDKRGVSQPTSCPR